VNALPFRRRALIEVPGAEPAVVEVDGFSARSIEVCAPAPPADVPGAGAAIENDRFRVEVDTDGTLALVDKLRDRELRGLHALEDEADMGDLYNFCPVEGAPAWRSDFASSHVLSAGPLVSELELSVAAERPAGLDRDFRPLDENARLTVRTVVRLVDGSDRVEFRTTIENGARDHRLRAVFPIAAVDGPVRAEGQFAVVRRPCVPPLPTTDWAEPPDPTQHTLGAVAVGAVALLTRGLPEYEVRPAGEHADLCLTLLRCVGIISQPEGVLATRPHAAGPQIETPEGQCLGRVECEYALLPDGGQRDDVALLRASQDYRAGFLTADVAVEFEAPLGLEGDVVFSCLKGAEDGDGLILRCFNPAASPTEVRVVGNVGVSRTRLDETGERPVPDGLARVGGFEVASFRLRPG
jgi:alpha-mannosidase